MIVTGINPVINAVAVVPEDVGIAGVADVVRVADVRLIVQILQLLRLLIFILAGGGCFDGN